MQQAPQFGESLFCCSLGFVSCFGLAHLVLARHGPCDVVWSHGVPPLFPRVASRFGSAVPTLGGGCSCLLVWFWFCSV